jgi:uncharacterized membrane protein YhiD involved in acid resistance
LGHQRWLICGAGLALIAVILSVIITVGMFFLDGSRLESIQAARDQREPRELEEEIMK